MADAKPQAKQHARLVAFIDIGDEDIHHKVADLIERGWRRRAAPIDFEVIEVDQPIKNSEGVSKKVDEAQAELTAAGIEPAAMTGHRIAPATGEVDRAGGYVVNLAGSPNLDDISKLIAAAVATGAPAANDGKTSPDSGGPPTPRDKEEGSKPDAKAEAGKTTAVPPVLADPAATIAATIPAFPDPRPLWAYIDKADRGDLARELVSDLNTSRTDFARRSEWVVAPEMVLLDACPSAQREDLAMKLLKVRGALTDADYKTRGAAAKLATQNAQLAEKRVEFAGKGVALAAETLKHMKKWRCIANIGLWVLGFTTAFSMVAVGYLLLYLAPHNDISDAVIPIIIFVLALFAISPAVLLLRERPLEGLDKWSPSGAVGDGKSSTSGTTEPTASSSAASPSAAGPAK